MKKIIFFYLLFFLRNINGKWSINHEKNLRNLWEENMNYDSSDRNNNELDSIEHCAKSDFKYFSYVVSGQEVIFGKSINNENAVSL